MKNAYLAAVFGAPLLLLSGCGTWEKVLATGGAAICGTAAGLPGKGSTSAHAARGAVAAAGCAYIGSLIGHSLDERDRQMQAQAQAQALQRRLPPQYYQPGFRADAYQQTAAGYGGAVPPSTAKRHIWSRPSSASAGEPVTDASAGSGRFPGLATVQGASWVSDHSGATGTVTVISAEKPKDGHGECRVLVGIVNQPGASTASEETKVCESRPGANDWAKL